MNIKETGNPSKNRSEVDFLIPDGRKISPIEVRSGYSKTHSSLDYLMKTYPKYLGQAYVVHTGDLRRDGSILYIPAYMAMCL